MTSKFVNWYGKNKDRLNKKRRDRYRKDQKYRNRQLANTKRWRKKNGLQRKAPSAPKTHFTIGEAAAMVPCDIQTIRLLERKGLLPVTTDGKKHRTYTKKQIALMARLIKFRQDNHYKTPGYRPRVQKLAQQVAAGW